MEIGKNGDMYVVKLIRKAIKICYINLKITLVGKIKKIIVDIICKT